MTWQIVGADFDIISTSHKKGFTRKQEKLKACSFLLIFNETCIEAKCVAGLGVADRPHASLSLHASQNTYPLLICDLYSLYSFPVSAQWPCVVVHCVVFEESLNSYSGFPSVPERVGPPIACQSSLYCVRQTFRDSECHPQSAGASL